MQRVRVIAALAVIVALTLVAVVAWQSGNQSAPAAITTTTATPATSSIVSITTTSTTTTAPSTTTTVDRVAEVTAILQNLWFGWFDAIYRKDPDTLWKVVATQRGYELGLAAMDTMTFSAAPTLDAVKVSDVEILLDRPDCLVAYSTSRSDFRGDRSSTSVRVLWPTDTGGWRFASAWKYKGDLWRADCDDVVRPDLP